MNAKNLKVGDRVLVIAPEAGVDTFEDVIRDITKTEIVLEPYARNQTVVCLVGTERSWFQPKDVLKILGR